MRQIPVGFLFFIVFGFLFSCKKQEVCCVTPPPPLLYAILDQNGKNILSTGKDSLLVNSSGGQFYDNQFQLISISSNSAFVNKYGGLPVYDSEMGSLSAGINTPTAVHSFTISYHGQSLGTLSLTSLKQHANWQEAKGFSLNNVPAQLDTSGGFHVYLLRLQ